MRKDIQFKTEDGVTLRGWHYLPDGRRGKVPTIVMAHGFSAVKEMYLEAAKGDFWMKPPPRQPSSGICWIGGRPLAERRRRTGPAAPAAALGVEPLVSGAGRCRQGTRPSHRLGALARKPLVALWRYVAQGLVPQGAVFKTADGSVPLQNSMA